MASAEKALNILETSQAQLTHLTSLLHLFHHRNKNQHRHSIWYRHFSLFRRSLNQLTSAIDHLNTTPTTNLARTLKKREDARLISEHEKRLVFWKDVMVPRWQRAFGQLVADGRFAVLGVVLMAVLSEVCGLVGVTGMFEEVEVEVKPGEAERVLGEFGREELRQVEDHGEVVRREEDSETVDVAAKAKASGAPTSKSTEVVKDAPKPSKKRSSEVPEKKSKKRRKKTGNAIDDIFG